MEYVLCGGVFFGVSGVDGECEGGGRKRKEERELTSGGGG